MDAQSLNFSEKYRRNPDEFDSSRFANGARPLLGSLFRFGLGPRKCLDYPYAQAITRIIVASVLQRYTLQLANLDAARRVIGGFRSELPKKLLLITLRQLPLCRNRMDVKNEKIPCPFGPDHTKRFQKSLSLSPTKGRKIFFVTIVFCFLLYCAQ